MNFDDDILSFLDLLDLDEELIDRKLRSIMVRNNDRNYSNKHLINAIQLFKYKQLINMQEETECENNEEFDFIVKLLKDLNEESIHNVCKIINIVLGLNSSSIVRNSEHMLQQILSSLFPLDASQTTDNKLQLQVCNSIIDAVLKAGQKVSLLLLEVPLEDVLESQDENLKIYFLTHTVPRLFEGVIGYNILDRIWKYVLNLKHEKKDDGLKILSCLSDYYIPVSDDKGIIKFESDIIFQYDFWNLVLYGLMSNDAVVRKTSIYLMKRAIDSITTLKKNINVKSETFTIFTWSYKNENKLKSVWDNFFILLDSLEEKQSNIVLPSLQLFDKLNYIDRCWLNSAFNLGLKHDNSQVRLKCIEYKLQTSIHSESEAIVLLEALNDINFYDNLAEYNQLEIKLYNLFKDITSFFNVFKAIPAVNWSPVPLYHISCILSDMKVKISLESTTMMQIINDILKIPCNIVAIRKAIHINLSLFIGNCCTTLDWKELIHIYSAFSHLNLSNDNLFMKCIKERINKDNVQELEKLIIEMGLNVELGQLCGIYDCNEKALDAISEVMTKIENVVKRQYSDKSECLKEVLFITKFLAKSNETPNMNCINIAGHYKTILGYVLSLLSDDVVLSIEDTVLLFEGLDSKSLIEHSDLLELELQIYKNSVLLLKHKNTELYKTVLSIHAVSSLSKSSILVNKYKHEMLNVETILKLLNNFGFNDAGNIQSGRLRNMFYEKSSEIIDLLLKDQDQKVDIQSLIDYIETVVECGGYGCLKWILRIMNKILSKILSGDKIKFDITQFMNRMWIEIEELKSNNQYAPCIKEFVNLITQDSILRKSTYNNIVISYCSKIIDNGAVRNTPLYYLIEILNGRDIEEYGQLVYVLCDILLYAPVPRKDQRIAENLIISILHNSKYGLRENEIAENLIISILHNSKYGLRENDVNTHFNYQIQYLSVQCLTSIQNPETLSIITSYITKKVDEVFKNKQRYHGNSQIHRFLLTALQHLIFTVTRSTINMEKTMIWCVQMLGKLPHQPSVRICMEWYISLYLYVMNVPIDINTLEMLKTNNVPLSSQFMIIYWVMKHRIEVSTKHTIRMDEFEFVMDTLLSHTMGQLFNVRLHAQYLASNLYKLRKIDKYEYVVKIIENTFAESSSDKNYMKLKEDYFANEFDIVGNLTPYFFYHLLPRYCEVTNNENIDLDYVKNVSEDIFERVNRNNNDRFTAERILSKINVKDDRRFYEKETKISLNDIDTGTIQKKYIPWRNMSDVNVYSVEKKRESPSDLIVVASLIDKLPNLGGMARTSEVFGVKTYVVDSLRHLQDKQFQGLSVSAERWINIEEVRPGQPLKDYLNKKKSEGYAVVAAEQTSSSTRLQGFKFPKKTLLLLGHEKEGVPCDLLPMMDHCVEIPQQGFVRSLNVHVTAAIFVWEYTRQNIL